MNRNVFSGVGEPRKLLSGAAGHRNLFSGEREDRGQKTGGVENQGLMNNSMYPNFNHLPTSPQESRYQTIKTNDSISPPNQLYQQLDGKTTGYKMRNSHRYSNASGKGLRLKTIDVGKIPQISDHIRALIGSD